MDMIKILLIYIKIISNVQQNIIDIFLRFIIIGIDLYIYLLYKVMTFVIYVLAMHC